jgi:hypothetical protein
LNYGFSQDINLEIFASYNGTKRPELSDFNSISVKHESPDFNYVIGNINLATLKNCSWIDEETISIVLTENNL